MKKENIFVVIDSEEKRLRALRILSDAGERIYEHSVLLDKFQNNIKNLAYNEGEWGVYFSYFSKQTEITLDQLEQLLNPNYTVKEVHITLDELKAQAEILGFELVKKERKPKVGDFGVFWDNGDTTLYRCFLTDSTSNRFHDEENRYWDNFRFLTDEEKEEIQNNW